MDRLRDKDQFALRREYIFHGNHFPPLLLILVGIMAIVCALQGSAKGAGITVFVLAVFALGFGLWIEFRKLLRISIDERGVSCRESLVESFSLPWTDVTGVIITDDILILRTDVREVRINILDMDDNRRGLLGVMLGVYTVRNSIPIQSDISITQANEVGRKHTSYGPVRSKGQDFTTAVQIALLLGALLFASYCLVYGNEVEGCQTFGVLVMILLGFMGQLVFFSILNLHPDTTGFELHVLVTNVIIYCVGAFCLLRFFHRKRSDRIGNRLE